MKSPTIEPMAVARLRPFAGNARTHSKKQVRQIADSIARFGFTNPILIDDNDKIIAGHGRLEAAKLLRLKDVPTLRLSGLDAAERRAYALADNKLALGAGWDRGALAVELRALADLQFDAKITGFSIAEIELVLDGAAALSSPSPRSPSGRLRPSEPAIEPAEGGTRWTGYGEGRGEGASPQAQTLGDAPSPGMSAKDALIPTSP